MSDLDPLPFRLLIDRILEPAKRHFRSIFLPIAVPLALCGIAAAVLPIGWLRALSEGDFGEILPLISGIFLLFVLIAATYGLAFSAALVASLDAVAGRGVDMGRAWAYALTPRVFGTLVVVAVLQLLSVMMCLFPALYATPVLAFVLPAMVEEDRFGLAAIRRSVELAHYNPTRRWTESTWLKMLVLLAVGMVIQSAVGLLAELPFVVAQQVIVLRDAVAGQATDPATLLASTLWLQLPAQILSAVATAVTWLVWTFGIGLLYSETRRRKEGADLQRAIDELTGTGHLASAATPPG